MNNKSITNEIAKNVWEEIGAWWDEHMVEGDTFHHYLIHPYILKRLDLTPQDNIIDLACGNGALTRKMARVTHKPIVGVDCSNALLECAKKRDSELGFTNTYHHADLMNEQSLQQIKYLGQFNKAVCSMAIQDIEDIKPLLNTVKSFLPDKGYFIISIPHPCFNSGVFYFKKEEQAIARSTYIKPVSSLLHAKDNQPLPHPHFHRPLSLLINTFATAGFALDCCDEPVFQEADLNKIEKNYLWSQFPEIPPVMILRFIA